MGNGRHVAITAALACTLAVPLVGSPVRADELSDLRANNELLQQRIDQLAQAIKIPGPGGFYTQGAPPAPSAGAGLVGGSFPRSFLIPGTDTSLRVGGEIRENLTYWFTGRSPNLAPPSSNVLNNGGLNSAPLHVHNAIVGGVVVPSFNPTRSRSHNVLYLTPQQTKFNFETRTPTAFGEARTFIELDFAGGSSFSPGGVNQLTSTDSLTPRMRYAYGTLGGFLAGQANSNFADPDSNPPQLEFGGQVGSPGVTRIPQVRYTQPLVPYGLLGALSFSAEAPETEVWTAGQGIIGSDRGDVSLAANPALTCTTTAGATPGTFVTSCPVGGTMPAVNPTKTPAPDLTAAWYIPQPWGHFDMSLVYRPALQFKDGRFVDQTMQGYGGHISGDVKPDWFGWDKDDITFQLVGGEGIGRYIGGNTSMVSMVSNYPALSPTTAAVGAAVRLKTVTAFGANTSYTHWWSKTLHSYAAVGIQHMDLPNNLRNIPVSATGAVGASTAANPVCPGGINAARLGGNGGCGLNRELVSASFGTVWNPVSFVAFGVEYAYGHRLSLSGLKGDTSAVLGRFAVRF